MFVEQLLNVIIICESFPLRMISGQLYFILFDSFLSFDNARSLTSRIVFAKKYTRNIYTLT